MKACNVNVVIVSPSHWMSTGGMNIILVRHVLLFVV